MTKKEIIDKVYDDYLKDYWRVGYIGMNSIEKACKSEFEKNGIEYSLYWKQIFYQGTQAPSIATSVNSGYACRLGVVSAPYVCLPLDFEYISLLQFYFCHSRYIQNSCLPKSMVSSNNFLTHQWILFLITLM